jgi:hypothetical protein
VLPANRLQPELEEHGRVRLVVGLGRAAIGGRLAVAHQATESVLAAHRLVRVLRGEDVLDGLQHLVVQPHALEEATAHPLQR